jgi:cell division protein FtsB
MTENKPTNNDKIENQLQNFTEKIEKLTSVLERFGMDIITKLGNMSFNINKLADTVKELDKATLDIKSLAPKLNNIIENQNSLEREIHLLRSLTYRSINEQSAVDITTKDNDKIENQNKKELILDRINTLGQKLNNITDYKILIKDLNDLQEEIFEYTGGNKILYEISQIVKKIKNEGKVTSPIKDIITAKLTFWSNRILR